MFLSAVYPPMMSGEQPGLSGTNLNGDETRFGQNTSNFGQSTSFETSCSEYLDGVILNGVRNRRKTGELPCCPVCSCTLRAHELQTHLSLEMDKLSKLSCAGKRKSAGTPNSSSSSSTGIGGDEIDVSGATGSDVYQRVRRNRERRLRAVARRAAAPVPCPVCGARLQAATADSHVEACLSGRGMQDDESVDVENSDSEGDIGGGDSGRGFGLTYSWGSEERVRAGALQLSEGGALPAGALLVRRASTDTTLVVDGDEDDLMYGPAQYSPERIAPQEEYEEHEPAAEVPGDGAQEAHVESGGGGEVVVAALKARVRELEMRLASKDYRTESKCLICMGPYSEPVVSIQCWHVYCETCWLESLRAKKTCPQCNAITTASHLRRIYM